MPQLTPAIEALAEHQHRLWCQQTLHLFEQIRPLLATLRDPAAPEYREAQAFAQAMLDLTQVPFSELPQEAQEEDRLLATKAIEVFTHKLFHELGNSLPSGDDP